MIALGEFKCKSGKLVVSDPCYPLGTWCQAEIDNAKKGIWLAYVKKIIDDKVWGERYVELIAHHKDHNLPENSWEYVSGNIGVDSGQAGIFDKESYRNDSLTKGTTGHKFATLDGPAGDRWYSACCDITLSRMHAGILEGGVVSESGYGDGSYDCYVAKDKNGKIMAVKITFIEIRPRKPTPLWGRMKGAHLIRQNKSLKPLFLW